MISIFGDFWHKQAFLGDLGFNLIKKSKIQAENQDLKKPAGNDKWDKNLIIAHCVMLQVPPEFP